jgi:glycosyltransferase involved in cell wall biosynthesis
MKKYNNPKISVIVSVYNTEKYVEKCIESLINQTYENIEIILIEDGSSDRSKEILKKYEKNKKCIVSYNDGNKGLAYSRNKGMELATGDFIGFIDSDDYISADYYEKFIKTIKEENADVAICDMKLVFENENNRETISKCCDEEWNLVNIINNGMVASACNKLFKKDLIMQYQFAVGKVNEDIAVVIPSLVNAKKIVYVPNCYYNYVQRNNSIQNSEFSEKRFDIFEAVDTTLERIKKSKYFDELKDAIIYNQIILLFIYVIPKENRFFYRRNILKKFNELSKKYEIRNNKCFWRFLDCSGKKNRLYYKLLFKLECSGLYIAANITISLYKFLYKKLKSKSVIKKEITMEDLISLAMQQNNKKEDKIKISVVIPNYNYEKFLYQRLYSILSQNYKLHEIIILDDCSKDNSRKLIDKLVSKLDKYINIKKIYNKENSGTAFKQWKKGFENATGDYVWIAEADDYCESNLLSNLVKPILKQNNVLISYADTAFIDADGKIIMKTVKNEIDIQKTGHWNKSYINDGINEIKNYTFLNCTLANVSSCIIKNDDYSNVLIESCDYKQAGDWVFYANVMKNGNIAYTNKVLNYYRVHGNNVSTTMNHQKHIDEINKIHSKFIKEFNLGSYQKNEMKKRIKFLKDNWKI